MASAKPLIIVLAILVGRVKTVLFVLKTLAVNMDTVTNRLNAIVNQVGLDPNVKEVELAILHYETQFSIKKDLISHHSSGAHLGFEVNRLMHL